MAHGTEQHHHAKALTPVFTIYTILLQETTDRRWQRPFAALCIANCISLYGLQSKHALPPLCFLQRPPCCLWYDGDARASSDSTSGKEEMGWTLSRSWIR